MTSRAGRCALAAVAAVLLAGCGSDDARPRTAPAPEEVQDAAGTTVTVAAEVAGLVGPRAFTITREEGGPAEPLLVVPDRPVVLGEEVPVTVIGTIRTFRAAEHPGAASPVRLASYDGRPYLHASDVRTGDGSSLTRQ